LHDYADPELVLPILTNVGFSHTSQTIVHNVIETNNAGDIVTQFMEGTVRGGILLRSQPPDALANVRTIKQIKSKYGVNGSWINVLFTSAFFTGVAT